MKPIFAIPLILLTSACATLREVFSPENCESALRAATSLEQILATLVEHGMDPERAQKIADALLQGQIAISTACSAVPPV